MTHNRRSFLKTSLAGAAATALAACTGKASSATAKQTTAAPVTTAAPPLKLSFQEGIAPGNTLNEKFDLFEKLGVVGFEPGGKGLAARVNEIKEALSGRNIQVSAICAGFDGFILSTDEAVRKQFDTTMREIIVAAGQLQAQGVIMVPAFLQQTPVMPHTPDTRSWLCEELAKLGDFAVEHGTTVILEPLNRKETFYLRQVADAASICRDTGSRGVKCMGDFWHMTPEETSDAGALFSGGKELLQHIHIASRKTRNMPGEDGEADNYIDGFRALKQLGYDRYVSFECGCAGDRNRVLAAAVELLNKQWNEA